MPGAVDVGLSTQGQKPELDVQIDRGLAGSLGVTVGADRAGAARRVRRRRRRRLGRSRRGETRDVTVRLAPESRAQRASLESLPLALVRRRQGARGPPVVPLGQVATITQRLGPARIDHLDRDRVITVQANTRGPIADRSDGRHPGAARRTCRCRRAITLTQGGETADQQEVFGRILTALGIAVMLMYLMLVVQFGSFLDPLAILLSLPLSLIGVMLALLVTGSTLNLMSMIGVILLMGIVAKNAILLIDFAKWAEEAGMARREALIEAGRVRLRPILMTTLRADRRHDSGRARAAARAPTSARRSAARSSAA